MPGTPDAALDLVDDEEGAGVVAQLTRQREVTGVGEILRGFNYAGFIEIAA